MNPHGVGPQRVFGRRASLVPRGHLGFTADSGLLPHDVNRARALLAEPGHPNGLTVRAIH